MASWVITISKQYAQHWDYARRDGVWDMPKRFKIRNGDTVYFRVSGGPLIGQGIATTDARPLMLEDDVPWDDGRDPYTTRFTFRLLSDEPLATPSWGKVGPRLTKNPPLQGPRSWTAAEDEAVLASFFPHASGSPLETALQEVLQDAGLDVPALDVDALDQDLRDFAEQVRAVRAGQARFRRQLLDVYHSCAVTGTEVERVLDAAHISPFSGDLSNDVSNGMMLRRDIHRLFDDHLLTVTPEYTVRVTPELWGSEYTALDGRALMALPTQDRHRPSPELLRKHNMKCAWLQA
jgi:putative restriction endonuclease